MCIFYFRGRGWTVGITQAQGRSTYMLSTQALLSVYYIYTYRHIHNTSTAYIIYRYTQTFFPQLNHFLFHTANLLKVWNIKEELGRGEGKLRFTYSS